MIKHLIIKLMIVLGILNLYSCMQEDSTVKVTNGIETSSFPAVLRLRIIDSENKKIQICSSIVVSHNTAITAGHCLLGVTDPNNVRIEFTRGVFHNIYASTKFVVHPKYLDKTVTNRETYDIAVIVFTNNLFYDIEPLTVADAIPSEGTTVRLVGYGCFTKKNGNIMECDTSKLYYNKRTGTSEVRKTTVCDPNMLELVQKKATVDHDVYDSTTGIYLPTGEDVITAPGDSGAPALLESDNKKFVGITAFGEKYYEDNRPTCYTNPLYSENVTFFKQAVANIGAVIPWLQETIN